MTIQDIYTNYKIPKHLQSHMLMVTAVGEWIIDHWQGEQSLDQESIVTALLLHDMGNILKFNFSKGIELFDQSEQDLHYWLQVRKEYEDTYGLDEDKATLLIAKEIGVSERVLELIGNRGSSHLTDVVASDDWDLKVASYADFRVAPAGIVSVSERFAEIIKRYEGNDHVLADKEKTQKKRDLCLELEKQIQTKVRVALDQLTLAS